MGKHDDDAGGSALAGALSGPLGAGNLEAALHAARAYFLRHPGDEGAKRVVEAIELLMAQVWFGGAEEGEAPDARFRDAAQHLGSADLERALALYDEVEGEHAPRARRLALRVRVVRAAASGAPLPPPERIAPPPSFDDETRVAGNGELPLAAFAYDDVTANVDPEIPSDAYPEEVTRHLVLGDYELVDDAPAPEESEDEERTRILQPKQLEALKPKPVVDDGTREVTRIAGAGELPLEELRRIIEKEEQSKLDDLIGEIEKEPSAPKMAPPIAPMEPSLVLDITVDALEIAAKPVAPPRGPAVPPPPMMAPPAPPPAPAPVAAPERSAIAPEPPSEIRTASPAPPPASPPPSTPLAEDRPSRVAVSRSEGALPFVAGAGATTPEARAHRPSSPDAARARDSAPAPGSVPAPPPAPPPAPASISAARPDLLSTPPSGTSRDLPAPPASMESLSTPPSGTSREVPLPPPAPPPAPASIAAARPDLLSTPPSLDAPPRGPAVPPPPMMISDSVHAPLDTSEVALPSASAWTIREPGALGGETPAPIEDALDHSWSGVRTFEPEPAAFEPGVEPVAADTWADDEATMAGEPTPEQRAETLMARGELGEALRIYQEEAIKRPDEPHLWDRVAELARMLQQRST